MKEVGVGLDEGRRRSHAVGLSQAAKIMLAPNGAEAMATAIKSQPTRHYYSCYSAGTQGWLCPDKQMSYAALDFLSFEVRFALPSPEDLFHLISMQS